MMVYYDENLTKVAMVHEFRRPGGSIGASGLPDPKRIWLDDEILFC